MTEEQIFEFVTAFREIIGIKNVLSSFADFDWESINMNEQEFEDFKSKYLDIRDMVKNPDAKEKVSILEDVDFELELIHRDEVNVTYIMQLLKKLKDNQGKDTAGIERSIMNLLNTEAQLRSKRELIEKFIKENLPEIPDSDAIPNEFEKFWSKEQEAAFQALVKEENLHPEKTEKLIDSYLFAERKPLRDDALNLIEGSKPSVLQRRSIGDRIIQRIIAFVETFMDGVGV